MPNKSSEWGDATKEVNEIDWLSLIKWSISSALQIETIDSIVIRANKILETKLSRDWKNQPYTIYSMARDIILKLKFMPYPKSGFSTEDEANAFENEINKLKNLLKPIIDKLIEFNTKWFETNNNLTNWLTLKHDNVREYIVNILVDMKLLWMDLEKEFGKGLNLETETNSTSSKTYKEVLSTANNRYNDIINSKQS